MTNDYIVQGLGSPLLVAGGYGVPFSGPSGGSFIVGGLGTGLLATQGYGTPPPVFFSWPVVVGTVSPISVSPARSFATPY
jgi:hypothetical protein